MKREAIFIEFILSILQKNMENTSKKNLLDFTHVTPMLEIKQKQTNRSKKSIIQTCNISVEDFNLHFDVLKYLHNEVV